ncbi:hypothetical protein [Clostridium formicaceticum]|uniref:Uncharacterized protein n=1 Tax=Clostridium formicaceticum TaxID=1497 RepID=A0AAC9RKG2_9CLOT|nr:hypothetical protein [Clostridium formicaceticum]AOY76516.1 hypothetical protein BJL90_11995 [Clostridium formicaceticum]ARE86928.1 hypothetical protein CLFO_13120 [Clostridium formicaceticum]
MHPIHVAENTSIEAILSFIEEETAKYQTKYIVLSFHEDVRDIEGKRIVEMIKKHFDIFVILRSAIPNHQQNIEEYFSYGVHGIYFDKPLGSYSKEDIEQMVFATELFPRGWVFANVQNDKTKIEELLEFSIVPVPLKEDVECVEFIKSHEKFSRISRNLIKSIPLLDQRWAEYSLADKIKMKMLLETLNLRQKLMIKSIDASFNSSGL